MPYDYTMKNIRLVVFSEVFSSKPFRNAKMHVITHHSTANLCSEEKSRSIKNNQIYQVLENAVCVPVVQYV